MFYIMFTCWGCCFFGAAKVRCFSIIFFFGWYFCVSPNRVSPRDYGLGSILWFRSLQERWRRWYRTLGLWEGTHLIDMFDIFTFLLRKCSVANCNVGYCSKKNLRNQRERSCGARSWSKRLSKKLGVWESWKKRERKKRSSLNDNILYLL